MNLQKANLENLLDARFVGNWTPCTEKTLLKAIDAGDDQFLARVLRDHKRKRVSDPDEIKFRAAIDSFLSFCGTLEIAAMSGFIVLPSILVSELKFDEVLQNERLRLFYEEYYPTPLPQLLRLRLEGINSTALSESSNVALAFIQLNSQFAEQLEDSALLRMLDSFTIAGKRFEDVIDLIADPAKFMNAMLTAPEKRDIMGRALQNFSALMQFCFDLDALLSQRINDELLRSAVWYQYGYWFNILGTTFRDELGRAVSKFLNWDIGALGGDHQAALAVQQYVKDATRLLEKLTSKRSAEPIDSLLQELKRGPQLGMSF